MGSVGPTVTANTDPAAVSFSQARVRLARRTSISPLHYAQKNVAHGLTIYTGIPHWPTYLLIMSSAFQLLYHI